MAVHFNAAGEAFLAENLAAIEFQGAKQVTRASWIPASASFTRWSTTGD